MYKLQCGRKLHLIVCRNYALSQSLVAKPSRPRLLIYVPSSFHLQQGSLRYTAILILLDKLRDSCSVPLSPGMAFSFEIGDALLLSKIAFRLGQAFTSGRKSAPAEFKDIQNLLFNLSSALDLLKKHIQPDADQDATTTSSAATISTASDEGERHRHQNEVLDKIVSSCSVILNHLGVIIDKYMKLDETSRESEHPRYERWRRELVQNWKKIHWTTEGGDLDKLRSNLSLHITGLNLVVATLDR